MAEQKQKEMTPEEERAQTIKNARTTLENKVFQQIVGSGEILSHQAQYGSIAADAAKPVYDEAILSDEAKKIREALYKARREDAEKKGIYARPVVSDYDIEENIRDQVEEGKLLLPLGDLVSIIQGIHPGVKKIPKQLEAYVPAELAQRVAEAKAKNPKAKDEEILTSALNEHEQRAFFLYQRLRKAYSIASAYSISNAAGFADVNSFIDKLSEEYAPKAKK